MKCCASCLVLFFVLFAVTLIVQAVETTWPMLLGLGLSWASLRYIKAYYPREEE